MKTVTSSLILTLASNSQLDEIINKMSFGVVCKNLTCCHNLSGNCVLLASVHTGRYFRKQGTCILHANLQSQPVIHLARVLPIFLLRLIHSFTLLPFPTLAQYSCINVVHTDVTVSTSNVAVIVRTYCVLMAPLYLIFLN